MPMSTEPTCSCPDLAEQLRAAIDGRPPSTTCVVHDIDAAMNAAGVHEAEARAEVLRNTVEDMRASEPEPEESADPLLSTLERLLPPATGAVLPLNASSKDWARHIGLPSNTTTDGDSAA